MVSMPIFKIIQKRNNNVTTAVAFSDYDLIFVPFAHFTDTAMTLHSLDILV